MESVPPLGQQGGLGCSLLPQRCYLRLAAQQGCFRCLQLPLPGTEMNKNKTSDGKGEVRCEDKGGGVVG